MHDANERFMLPPGEGKSVWLGGLGVDFKIYGEQTAGSLSIVEHPIEPGRLVPPHVHADERTDLKILNHLSFGSVPC